jgi:glucose/arabinose dehydrogenase
MRPTALTVVLAAFLLGSAARAATTALPYGTAPALAPLTFEQPVAIVTAPGETNRLFVVEKPGRIVAVPDLAQPRRTVLLDLADRVGDAAGERGLLALAFHPDFARNRRFYVWYTYTHDGRSEDRLARFTLSAANPAVADPASEQVILSQADEASNHNGGQVLFGPDGYLYLSLGDEGRANDSFQNSQRIDKDFFSGIVRIDVDARPGNPAPNPHPAVGSGTYAVPRDNPFVGATTFNGAPVDPARVRTEFWAVGLRNPWRMAFDPATGQLWCADVGQNSVEEINLIVRGGNYGWNYREARLAGPRGGAPAGTTFLDPVWDYPRDQGNSVSGGFVYRGQRYPDLDGHYLFADYASGRIWALRPDGNRRVSADRVRQIAQLPSVTSFGLDPRTGEILVASLTAGLHRLVPAGPK